MDDFAEIREARQMPSLARNVSIGHHRVNADGSRFAPTNAVNGCQSRETR